MFPRKVSNKVESIIKLICILYLFYFTILWKNMYIESAKSLCFLFEKNFEEFRINFFGRVATATRRSFVCYIAEVV